MKRILVVLIGLILHNFAHAGSTADAALQAAVDSLSGTRKSIALQRQVLDQIIADQCRSDYARARSKFQMIERRYRADAENVLTMLQTTLQQNHGTRALLDEKFKQYHSGLINSKLYGWTIKDGQVEDYDFRGSEKLALQSFNYSQDPFLLSVCTTYVGSAGLLPKQESFRSHYETHFTALPVYIQFCSETSGTNQHAYAQFVEVNGQSARTIWRGDKFPDLSEFAKVFSPCIADSAPPSVRGPFPETAAR